MRCKVCRLETRTTCRTCKKNFCHKHMRDSECWSCARKRGEIEEDKLYTLCSLCEEAKTIDFQRTIDYQLNVCYDCARKIDEEYIKHAQSVVDVVRSSATPLRVEKHGKR